MYVMICFTYLVEGEIYPDLVTNPHFLGLCAYLILVMDTFSLFYFSLPKVFSVLFKRKVPSLRDKRNKLPLLWSQIILIRRLK